MALFHTNQEGIMEQKLSALIAGGDRRFLRLSALLQNRFTVSVLGFSEEYTLPYGVKRLSHLHEVSAPPSLLILPLPISRDQQTVNAPLSKEPLPLSQVLDLCGPYTLVAGGLFSTITEEMKHRSLPFFDYGIQPDFLNENATLTAKGALTLLQQKKSEPLLRKNILITGYGRIGSRLSHLLKTMGASVTVALRKEEDRRKASVYGIRSTFYPVSDIIWENADMIINTVPSSVIGKEEIQKTKPDAYFLELASAPFGIDQKAVEESKRSFEKALSIPSDYYPDEAAKCIYRQIEKMLSERRLLL